MLNDLTSFSGILYQNQTIPGIAGQITLCLDQTLLCGKVDQNFGFTKILSKYNNLNNNELALKIVYEFEKFRIEDRFFALDNFRNLISPQEYFAAKNFLNKDFLQTEH